MGSRLTILRPGSLPYGRAYELQQRLARATALGGDPTLILLEHPPTYTLGTRGNAAHVLSSTERLSALGTEVVRTDRGGDVTFHGPGQIVGYPILDLRQLGIGAREYVCGIEGALIEMLSRSGIAAARSPLNRGVWVGDHKIAAIGVRVSRGITTHGFALNVNTDLGWFDHIIPCGLAGVGVTSMQHETGLNFDLAAVQEAIIYAFAMTFGMTVAELPEATL